MIPTRSTMLKHDIAVLIKTTPKRKSLLWVVNSIDLSLNNYRLYIADEKPIDSWKKELYEKLEKEGHYIKIWNERMAVTKARNHLVSQLQDEKYVMRLDDDFELGGEFNIESMLKVLERDDIDFCASIERQIGEGKTRSGQIRIESGFFTFKKNSVPTLKILDDSKWKYIKHNGIRFAHADYFRNLFLIKSKCFDTVKWNEDLIFSGEHIDFFMELKKNGFKGVFTPDSIHLHRDDLKHVSLDIENEQVWRSKDIQIHKKRIFKEKWNGVPVKKHNLFFIIKKKFRRLYTA